MKNKFVPIAILFFCIMAIFQVRADVSLMAARVGAEDVLRAGEFYMKAFGLSEVAHLELASGNVELVLGFVETNSETIATMGPGIAILGRESDAAAESMPHIIFRVSDIYAVYANALELGGTEVREPIAMDDLGITIAMLKDPAGNIIELLERI